MLGSEQLRQRMECAVIEEARHQASGGGERRRVPTAPHSSPPAARALPLCRRPSTPPRSGRWLSAATWRPLRPWCPRRTCGRCAASRGFASPPGRSASRRRRAASRPTAQSPRLQRRRQCRSVVPQAASPAETRLRCARARCSCAPGERRQHPPSGAACWLVPVQQARCRACCGWSSAAACWKSCWPAWGAATPAVLQRSQPQLPQCRMLVRRKRQSRRRKANRQSSSGSRQQQSARQRRQQRKQHLWQRRCWRRRLERRALLWPARGCPYRASSSWSACRQLSSKCNVLRASGMKGEQGGRRQDWLSSVGRQGKGGGGHKAEGRGKLGALRQARDLLVRRWGSGHIYRSQGGGLRSALPARRARGYHISQRRRASHQIGGAGAPGELSGGLHLRRGRRLRRGGSLVRAAEGLLRASVASFTLLRPRRRRPPPRPPPPWRGRLRRLPRARRR